jgi:hypothetical protein
MSLLGGNKSMNQDSSQGGTPKWLKNGEKILGEFGECSASILLDLKEKLSNKKGLFASMQRGLINARESLVKSSPFGNFMLFVKFKDQELSNLNKFVQLLFGETGAAADYKANEALIRKDYFH